MQGGSTRDASAEIVPRIIINGTLSSVLHCLKVSRSVGTRNELGLHETKQMKAFLNQRLHGAPMKRARSVHVGATERLPLPPQLTQSATRTVSAWQPVGANVIHVSDDL